MTIDKLLHLTLILNLICVLAALVCTACGLKQLLREPTGYGAVPGNLHRLLRTTSRRCLAVSAADLLACALLWLTASPQGELHALTQLFRFAQIALAGGCGIHGAHLLCAYVLRAETAFAHTLRPARILSAMLMLLGVLSLTAYAVVNG